MSSKEPEEENVELEGPKKKGMKLPILIAIIFGIIIVQAGIVFAAIKLYTPHDSQGDKAKTEQHGSEKNQDEEHANTDEHAEDPEEEGAKLVHKVGAIVQTKNDLYINPRGTSANIVVMSLGIEIEPAEKVKDVEEKLMVPITDRVISRVSSYTLEELQTSAIRDSLRIIIKNDIKPYFRGLSDDEEHAVKLKNLYFSKFVIQ